MTSKKLTEVLDHSAVNFMVGCTLLILSIKNFNSFSHKKIMPSRYFHRKYGLYLDSFIISSSSSDITKCYAEVPIAIAVPHFCLSIFFPKVNMLAFNTTSATSVMVPVETYSSFQLSSRFLNADRPSSCGMFEYNPTTSIVHKIMGSGNFGRERSFFRNSLVSLI